MNTKPFNIEEAKAGAKVVTRSGHNVRILCFDNRGNMPIVALIAFETLDAVALYYQDGKHEMHREYDLFLVSEEEKVPNIVEELKAHLSSLSKEEIQKEWKELQVWYDECFSKVEELTEFDKYIKALLEAFGTQEGKPCNLTNDSIKRESKKLLELARKEISKYNVTLSEWETLAEKFKDLPKWKKCPNSTGPFIDEFRNEKYLYLNDYVIKISDLEKLPKED